MNTRLADGLSFGVLVAWATTAGAAELLTNAAPTLDLQPATASTGGLSSAPARQTTAVPTPDQDDHTALSTAGPRLRFGQPGYRSWTIGTGWAPDFEGSLDANLHASLNWFLIQDVEFSLEGAAWHFNQPGDNEGGGSLSIVFRWHFLNKESWSLFADAGIGALLATGDVPDGGTSFDLLPRLGAGATFRLDDQDTRLIVGVRWHHISNARINGDDENPSRDAPMLYAGLVFPF